MQRDIAGAAPSLELILDTFAEAIVHSDIQAGSYGSVAIEVGGYWLFDVCPKNFVLGVDGEIYAIDVLVQKEGDEVLWD